MRIPKFKLCYSLHDVENFAIDIGYPIICKPVDNRGSIGVVKINRYEDIHEAFITAMTHSRSQLVLAEEFIQGKQFTVDGYVKPDNLPKSLAIGEKFMYSGVQIAMGISYPASLDDKDYNRLLLLNEDVNFKLGYSFGMIIQSTCLEMVSSS